MLLREIDSWTFPSSRVCGRWSSGSGHRCGGEACGLEGSRSGRRRGTGRRLRSDLVVPAEPFGTGVQRQLSHSLVADADAEGVLAGDPAGRHMQALAGSRGADVVQDRGEGVQRPALPVGTEDAEETMLNRIPCGATAGVVGHAHAQAMAVAQDALRGVLPSAGAAAVAAAAVGEDQEGGGLGIAGAALGAQTGLDAVDGEAGGVGGIDNTDAAAVGLHVVDAVGHGAALGEGAEVGLQASGSTKAPHRNVAIEFSASGRVEDAGLGSILFIPARRSLQGLSGNLVIPFVRSDCGSSARQP